MKMFVSPVIPQHPGTATVVVVFDPPCFVDYVLIEMTPPTKTKSLPKPK
jgi:hypothetical protein